MSFIVKEKGICGGRRWGILDFRQRRKLMESKTLSSERLMRWVFPNSTYAYTVFSSWSGPAGSMCVSRIRSGLSCAVCRIRFQFSIEKRALLSLFPFKGPLCPLKWETPAFSLFRRRKGVRIDICFLELALHMLCALAWHTVLFKPSLWSI